MKMKILGQNRPKGIVVVVSHENYTMANRGRKLQLHNKSRERRAVSSFRLRFGRFERFFKVISGKKLDLSVNFLQQVFPKFLTSAQYKKDVTDVDSLGRYGFDSSVRIFLCSNWQ